MVQNQNRLPSSILKFQTKGRHKFPSPCRRRNYLYPSKTKINHGRFRGSLLHCNIKTTVSTHTYHRHNQRTADYHVKRSRWIPFPHVNTPQALNRVRIVMNRDGVPMHSPKLSREKRPSWARALNRG